ncbi:MAG: hypothetical protein ACLQGU_02545 [bacterium]
MRTWGERCLESIRREKEEIERRYDIRIGQTDIHCARCGKPWGYSRHVCQNVRLKQLQEKQSEKREVLNHQKEHLLDRLRKIGAKKIYTISFSGEDGSIISEKAISQWIYRKNIPLKYVKRVEGLINSVSV